MSNEEDPFGDPIQLRRPRIPSLVDAATARKCTTVSNSARRAVIDRLATGRIDIGVLA